MLCHVAAVNRIHSTEFIFWSLMNSRLDFSHFENRPQLNPVIEGVVMIRFTKKVSVICFHRFIMAAVKSLPIIVIVHIIISVLLWDHWIQFEGHFEERALLKPVLKGVVSVGHFLTGHGHMFGLAVVKISSYFMKVHIMFIVYFLFSLTFLYFGRF